MKAGMNMGGGAGKRRDGMGGKAGASTMPAQSMSLGRNLFGICC